METWVEAGEGTIGTQTLEKLRRVIEEESAIIVEHRFFRLARSPNRIVFDSFPAFEKYFLQEASPGDRFLIWAFESCCRDDLVLVSGKKPDANGKVPLGGAY